MSLLIAGYEIDAEIRSEPAFESDVTEHPVEEGADVADHVRARPVELVIEGCVSDTPLAALALRRNTFTLVDGEAFSLPSEEAFAFLTALHEKRQPVTVQTARRTYDNMILRRLDAPHDATTGDAFMFTAVFRQIRFVTNSRTTIRVSVPSGANKVNRGNKGAVDATETAPAFLATAPSPRRP